MSQSINTPDKEEPQNKNIPSFAINKCFKCGSPNIYGLSRVIGYYSIIENWNESKQAELIDRQKGRYQI